MPAILIPLEWVVSNADMEEKGYRANYEPRVKERMTSTWVQRSGGGRHQGQRNDGEHKRAELNGMEGSG